MRGVSIVVAIVISASGTAHAGRTFYGWLFGTEVMPERGAEIQTWISEENRLSRAANATETHWWIGPLIGVTDQLELALPVEVSWSKSDIQAGRTAFDNYGVEARFRLVTQDPVDAPDIAPLVRVAVKRLVLERETVRGEADFVMSYQSGKLHALVDVGMLGDVSADAHHFEVRPGAGLSIEAIADLRLGAEVFAELTLDDAGVSWVAAGPNLAWSHGRTWLSAAFGIGLYGIRDAPRFQWGIAF